MLCYNALLRVPVGEACPLAAGLVSCAVQYCEERNTRPQPYLLSRASLSDSLHCSVGICTSTLCVGILELCVGLILYTEYRPCRPIVVFV